MHYTSHVHMIGLTLRTDSPVRNLFSKSSIFVLCETSECLLLCSSFLTLHLFPLAFFRSLWWNDRIKNGWLHNAKLFRLKLWYLYSLIFIFFSEYSNQLNFKFVNLRITWIQMFRAWFCFFRHESESNLHLTSWFDNRNAFYADAWYYRESKCIYPKK